MAGGLQLFGATDLLVHLNRAIAAARGDQNYWVGSAVPYGPFHEFGTARVGSRPHWSVAIPVIARRYGLSSQQNELVSMMVETPRGLVIQVAFDLEREVKLQIRAQGIIDTANYVGSIAAAETEEAAFSLSESRRIDR